MTSQLRILRFLNGTAVLEKRGPATSPWAGWDGDRVIARGSVEACRAAARNIGVLVRDDYAAEYRDGVDAYPDPGSYEEAVAACYAGTNPWVAVLPPLCKAGMWDDLVVWRANAWVLERLNRPVPPHTASDF